MIDLVSNISNNSSNNFGLSTVPKMLAQLPVYLNTLCSKANQFEKCTMKVPNTQLSSDTSAYSESQVSSLRKLTIFLTFTS